MPKVLVHREGTVARVELNRPDKHNGVDLEVIDELMVYWPSGLKTKVDKVRANQRLRIVEGSSESVEAK